MNYDQPNKKQKNLSRQGRCARKPKRKTNNEQAASFFLCEKMLDLMMEILPSILGNRPPPPPKDNRAFLVAVFDMLAKELRWRALPIERANREAFTPNLTVGPRGTSGQNSLSNSSKG